MSQVTKHPEPSGMPTGSTRVLAQEMLLNAIIRFGPQTTCRSLHLHLIQYPAAGTVNWYVELSKCKVELRRTLCLRNLQKQSASVFSITMA
jgi:hypothetical protein